MSEDKEFEQFWNGIKDQFPNVGEAFGLDSGNPEENAAVLAVRRDAAQEMFQGKVTDDHQLDAVHNKLRAAHAAFYRKSLDVEGDETTERTYAQQQASWDIDFLLAEPNKFRAGEKEHTPAGNPDNKGIDVTKAMLQGKGVRLEDGIFTAINSQGVVR